MNRRQADELENQLELLVFQPVVRLSKSRLRQIFDAERLSKNSWRDIFERLPEGVEADDLQIAEFFDDLFVIRSSFFQTASRYT